MSTFFKKAREGFLDQSLNWLTHDFRVVLLVNGTSINADTAQYLADIDAANRVVTSELLTGKTATDGYAGSASASFIDFLDLQGRLLNQAVLYRDTGDPATSLLVVHYPSGTGLSFVGAGRNYFLGYSTTAHGWFRL